MASPLTADTSLIVPSLLSWHTLHAQAAAALKDVRRIPSHAIVEAYSVLTRLPPPGPLPPALALAALLRAFPEEPLSLSTAGYLATVRRLAQANLGGGRVYDAIIGTTAPEAGIQLLTADRRAIPTYALMGAEYRLVD